MAQQRASSTYLTTPATEKGAEIDPDLRRLQFKKNNYGPVARDVLLRWRNGVYVLEPSTGSLEQRARESRADEQFVALLGQFERQGRLVSDRQTANNYAPAAFAKGPTANGVNKAEFEKAMLRLFAANKIRVEPYGKPSRGFSKIVVCIHA